MIKVFGENYYFDLDKIEEYVNIPNISGSIENHISVVKFELVKSMIDVVLSENEPIDEALGNKSTDITIPFKIAFNTLENKKLINKF